MHLPDIQNAPVRAPVKSLAFSISLKSMTILKSMALICGTINASPYWLPDIDANSISARQRTQTLNHFLFYSISSVHFSLIELRALAEQHHLNETKIGFVQRKFNCVNMLNWNSLKWIISKWLQRATQKQCQRSNQCRAHRASGVFQETKTIFESHRCTELSQTHSCRVFSIENLHISFVWLLNNVLHSPKIMITIERKRWLQISRKLFEMHSKQLNSVQQNTARGETQNAKCAFETQSRTFLAKFERNRHLFFSFTI